MDKELKTCMIEMLKFLDSQTYQGIESLAGSELSKKYSKDIIDKSICELVDNQYVLGSTDHSNGKFNYFVTGVTQAGLDFLQKVEK